MLERVQIGVHHRRDVERDELREGEAAHHRDAQRPPRFRPRARTESDRQRSHQRRHRRHHDRPESDARRLEDRVARALSFLPLRLDREVDHHDRVLLHDADEHDDADERVHAEIELEDEEREQRAEPGERKARQNGERVDEALVQDAEHEVDHHDREDQEHAAAPVAPPGRPAPCRQKLVLTLDGRVRRARFWTSVTAVPSEVPGARLNESVTEGIWPE